MPASPEGSETYITLNPEPIGVALENLRIRSDGVTFPGEVLAPQLPLDAKASGKSR